MPKNSSRFVRSYAMVAVWLISLEQLASVHAMEDLGTGSSGRRSVPDLQGILSIATQTNLERADRFQ